MIKNDAELEKVVEKVGGDLQAIQDYLGTKSNSKGRVRFPRGFIHTTSTIKPKLPKINKQSLERNISYALMMTDIFRWLLIRTDITSIAKEMIIKEGICIFGSICESLSTYFLKGKDRKLSYKPRTKKFVELGIIGNNLKNELDWVWDTRCKEHLYGLDHPEFNHYRVRDYNRAVKAYTQFRDSLKFYFG
jgi:hypothetical protein